MRDQIENHKNFDKKTKKKRNQEQKDQIKNNCNSFTVAGVIAMVNL